MAKDFLKLQRYWYKKIEKTGFVDIEVKKNLPEIDPRVASIKDHEAVRAYYSMTACYLHRGVFQSDTERDIWEAHCHGKSYRQIAKEVGESKDFVAKVIQKHLKNLRLRQNP